MRRSILALSFALVLLAMPTHAAAPDPLAHVDVVSAIGLARLADEQGDGTLARWLKDGARRDLQLVALRASPFAFAPERLVAHIAPLLCGRDPTLAPEAALALAQLADTLRPSLLAVRETFQYDLRAAKQALRCVREQEPAPRADLVAAAQLLEAALAQL